MNTDLRDRVVLVTGASGGIGGETARQFAAEGARLALHCHRSRDAAEQLADELAGSVVVQGDLTLEADVARVVAEAERALGPLQVLVANAGVWPADELPVVDLPLSRWNETIAHNLTATFLCAREMLRSVRRHGTADPAIVITGSTAGVFGEANHADYAAAKSAMIHGLLLSLKNEIVRLAPRGRVNAVSPGWTVTPMVAAAMSDDAQVRRVVQTMPLRKLATPADIAAAIVWLSSSRLAGHITGQSLTIAGGMEGRVLHAGPG